MQKVFKRKVSNTLLISLEILKIFKVIFDDIEVSCTANFNKKEGL